MTDREWYSKVNFRELISKAIEKNEVIQLLRGEREYELIVSEFEAAILPTDVNSVLVDCFYKQIKNIADIDVIFTKALNDLMDGNACDLYIAVLYFEVCIFHEEEGGASFYIDRKKILQKLKARLHEMEYELYDSVEFDNGMIEDNPWNNIVNLNNNYFKKRYRICII